MLAYDVWKALWFVDAATGQTRSASASARWCCALNVVLLGGYTFGCHSLRHLVGGRLDCLFGTPGAAGLLHVRQRLNRAHMLWAWISLFSVGVLRRLRPPVLDGHLARLEALLMARVSDPRARRAGDRRRRRRPARRDRGVGGRRLGRPRVQVAARQGAHRDGRRRRRRRARQRRRSRQLAGPLRRHDARRAVPQQLAHGARSTPRKRRPACANSKRGARCSTARRTAGSCSATSAATAIRGWRTSATAPASR